MIVLAHGPDAATARAEITQLIRAHDPEGSATTRLDGRTAPVAQIASMAGTPGFFGEARVILVEDLMARASKGKGSADDESESSEAAASKVDFASLFGAVLPQNLLVLVDTALSSIPAAIRKAAPGDARIISGDPPRGKRLIEWMQERAREAGSNLPPAVAQELAEMLFPQTWAAKPANARYDRPPDLDVIRNEVEKLSLAAYPDAIERRHLREMTDSANVDRLFPFLEATVGGSVGQAARELRTLQDAGEDGHRLSAQLYQQVELAAVHEAARSRVDPVEVGRALGLPNPNRMIGIARTRRSIPAEIAVERSRTIDRMAKTGELRDPMDTIYGLMSIFADPAASNRQRRSG